MIAYYTLHLFPSLKASIFHNGAHKGHTIVCRQEASLNKMFKY